MALPADFDPRGAVLGGLLPRFTADRRHVLLVLDCGFARVDPFLEVDPNRVIECGIREQAAVGVAAGMAAAGCLPVVYSIASFLVYRALEFMRLDVVLTDLPVKFIGYGSGETFRHLGRSHACGRADIELLETIGMSVYDPRSSHAAVEGWLNHMGPAYFRA